MDIVSSRQMECSYTLDDSQSWGHLHWDLSKSFQFICRWHPITVSFKISVEVVYQRSTALKQSFPSKIFFTLFHDFHIRGFAIRPIPVISRYGVLFMSTPPLTADLHVGRRFLRITCPIQSWWELVQCPDQGWKKPWHCRFLNSSRVAVSTVYNQRKFRSSNFRLYWKLPVGLAASMFDSRDALQHRCEIWEILAGRNCAKCCVFP